MTRGQKKAIQLLEKCLVEFDQFARTHISCENWQHYKFPFENNQYSFLHNVDSLGMLYCRTQVYPKLENLRLSFGHSIVFLKEYLTLDNKFNYNSADSLAEAVETNIRNFVWMLSKAINKICYHRQNTIEEQEKFYEEIIHTKEKVHRVYFDGTGLEYFLRKQQNKGLSIHDTMRLLVASIATATYRRLRYFMKEEFAIQIIQIYCFLAYYQIIKASHKTVNFGKDGKFISFAGITFDRSKLMTYIKSEITLKNHIHDYIMQEHKMQFSNATELLDYLCDTRNAIILKSFHYYTNITQHPIEKTSEYVVIKGGTYRSDVDDFDWYLPNELDPDIDEGEYIKSIKLGNSGKYAKRKQHELGGFRLVLQKN